MNTFIYLIAILDALVGLLCLRASLVVFVEQESQVGAMVISVLLLLSSAVLLFFR